MINSVDITALSEVNTAEIMDYLQNQWDIRFLR